MPITFVPCIWLDDTALEAATFWARALPGGAVGAISRYPATGDNPSGKPPGSVLGVEVTVAGQRLFALNGGPMFRPNPSVSFFVHEPEVDAARRQFDALADGGTVMMPFGAWPWSPGFGWVQDRFGVSWQVLAGPRPAGSARIVPCLLYTGAALGRAEEAMRRYVEVFPGSEVQHVERYGPGEGLDGGLKHGRCVVAGQEMALMDGPGGHAFAFDEGLSVQALCDTQAEIDALWAALGDGGAPGPCGWLRDRFGLHWQVNPTVISAVLAGPDAAAAERVFRATMRMGKIDLATLERAAAGE